MQKLPLHKKLLSYLYPIPMRKADAYNNSILELFLYRGQWQLANDDALYSDGDKYRPLLIAFRNLEQILPSVKKVLVLGAGLGSAVQILHKMGQHPAVTLVDIDKLILQWALELAAPETAANIQPVCADAKEFLKTDNEIYDIVVVDIFEGRQVPAFVTAPDFLEQCKQRVAAGGHLVLNYIINDYNSWDKVKAGIDAALPQNKILKFDINRVFVARI